MALDDIYQGYGLTVLDPKGGLVEQLINYIPEEILDRVIYLDGLREIPIDFLHWDTPLERSILADDVMVTFERFSDSSAGDQWKSILQYAILTILEARGSFLDIYYFLTRDDKQSQILARISDPDLLHYWTYEYPKLKGHSETSILTRMAKFLLTPSLKAMLGSAHPKLHIPTIIEEGKILLVNLNEVGEKAANIIGTLLVSQIQQAIFKRKPEKYRAPYYVYVDEFQDFKSTAFAQILKKARGFGLGLTLVSLHPKQLGDLIEDVKGCVTSYVFFKMAADQAHSFRGKLKPYTPEDLEDMSKFTAIYRGEHGTAQIINTQYPPPPPTATQLRNAEIIRNRTVEKYGCDTKKNVVSLEHGLGNNPSEEKPDPEPSGAPGLPLDPGKKTGP